MEYFPGELQAPSWEVGLELVIGSAGLPYSLDLVQAGLWGPPQDVGLELVIAGSAMAHAFQILFGIVVVLLASGSFGESVWSGTGGV